MYQELKDKKYKNKNAKFQGYSVAKNLSNTKPFRSDCVFCFLKMGFFNYISKNREKF